MPRALRRRPALESPAADLTPEQQAWAEHAAALWHQAHLIAAEHPGMDAGDVYHALRCLELPTSVRLERGLNRVRNRPHTR